MNCLNKVRETGGAAENASVIYFHGIRSGKNTMFLLKMHVMVAMQL